MRTLVLAEDNKPNVIGIFKMLKPDSRLPESYQKDWKTALAFEHPYDQEPYKEDDTTNIIGINSKYKDMKDKSNKSLNFIYTMVISKQGNVDNAKMKEQLDKVNTQLNIKE
jgi:transcription initiation factor IIF auxiliary subunit